MVYADTTRARSLAGNPSTTNVSANDCTQAVAYGDSMVNTITDKTDWSSGDKEYAAIQTASEYLASHYMRSRFKDDGDKAQEHFDFAMMLLEKIRSGATLIHIASQGHRTYPLNPDATPYRSTSGSSSSVDDSDLE
jgi:hypothetical protein